MKIKTQHIARRIPRKITLLLVPNNSEQIKKITFSPWIPKTVSLSLIVVIGVLSFSTYRLSGSLNATTNALFAEQQLVASLQEEAQQHMTQIDELHRQFRRVDERLASLNQLESKVLTMVGLENTYKEGETQDLVDEAPGSALASDTGFILPSFLLVSRSSNTRTLGPVIDNYEVDVEQLSQLIETQTLSMVQLAENVEEQLEYLDAQPNFMPARGRITSPFGNRVSPTNRFRREFHQGIDIAGPSGTPILAAGSGIVTYSGFNGGYGRMVIISHGYGYTSVYAHNSQNLVEVGDRVEKGDLIAKMGRTGRATGTHLHFEIRVHGEPIDPMTILHQ